GAHGIAVEQHRAGAAHAVLAAEMGAGQPAILADRVGERAPRLDADIVPAPVDREREVDLVAHGRCSMAARSAARMRRGVAGISSIVTPRCASASLIALRTAAGAPIVPPSPSPLARVTDPSAGVSK